MKLRMLLALGAAALASASDRPDLSGTWRLEGSSAAAVSIAQTDGELSISNKAGTDVKCGISGKGCDATIEGERVNVSYWFNGPVLVEMATGGKHKDHVVKTRRSLADDGQRMQVEVMPIAPPGKTEKLTYVKVQP